MYGEMEIRMYDTYNSYVMPHGNHVYKTTTDIIVATMCTFESDKYDLHHWKCVF